MQTITAPYSILRRGVVSLVVLLGCALFGLGTARADELQDATKFLKAGQHREALERVNKALAAKPRDPQARFLKAVILTEQGNTREAIDIFTRLTQDFPDLPEPYNNLAVIYASQGQYEKARQALEMSIRTHPAYATAYENLGDVYSKLASQAYDKALQLDNSNQAAKSKLALMTELISGSGRPRTVVAGVPQPARPPEKAAPPQQVAQAPKAPEPAKTAPEARKAEKQAESKPAQSPRTASRSSECDSLAFMSVGPDPGFPDDLGPAADLAAHEFAELLRGRGADFDALLRKAFFHLGAVQQFRYLAV